MNPEALGRLAEVTVVLLEHLLDEPDLERATTLVERDVAMDHRGHQPIEEVPQGGAAHRSRPASRRYASMYFSRVFMTTSSGSAGTGGCLFHLIASR